MTFNVLIATVGRPSLQNMLDSLAPQLEEQDCLTIIFDGHSSIPEFDTTQFKCVVNQFFEPSPLGFWGHGIRNKYAKLLERRDFIMHADDDDIYFPGAFDELRKQSLDKNTLYICKMQTENGIIGYQIKKKFIGTPCGVIPYELNIQGNWGEYCGGDGMFYEMLASTGPQIEYLDLLIYNVSKKILVKKQKQTLRFNGKKFSII